MKTLVIHPKDASTDFLRPIYEDLNCTIIKNTKDVSKSFVEKAIRYHDRIIMMGHGSPHGLFFSPINSSMVYLLREKPNSIYIWCNADKFVEHYDLKGFATGMIISEVWEAMACGVEAEPEEVQDSNMLFSKIIKESVKYDNCEEAVDIAKEFYKLDGNRVIDYNKQNLFLFS